MDERLVALVTFAVCIGAYLVTTELMKARGRELGRRFLSLGVLVGRTQAEIIAAVGPPTSISGTEAGGSLVQWITTTYHVCLAFDANQICLGCTHEACAH